MSKRKEKELAVTLRMQGKTYNEILSVVPVAKSTLSLWLRDVGLSKQQRQTITDKKRAAQKRGGAVRRQNRLVQTEKIYAESMKDVKSLSQHDLFLVGIALYWAEGAKKNGVQPSTLVDFGNSDPDMMKLFISWLQICCKVTTDEMTFRLHLHTNHAYQEEDLKKLWTKKLALNKPHFIKTNFKKHNPKTNRKKTDDDYIGLLSVRVKKSTVLHRRIMGWICAIIATQK